MHRLVIALLACGCGRVEFDERTDARVAIDATPDAAIASRCDASDLLCDGFESGDFAMWQVRMGAGNVTPITDAYLGTHAMRATAAAGGHAYLAGAFSPLVTGKVYVQAHVRIPSGPTIDPAEAMQLARFGKESDAGHVHFLIDTGDHPVAYPVTGSVTAVLVLQRDRWVCMSIVLDLGSSGALAMAFDDTPYVTLAPTAIESGEGGYAELSVGVVSSGAAQTQFAIDFDEVRVSRALLACN